MAHRSLLARSLRRSTTSNPRTKLTSICLQKCPNLCLLTGPTPHKILSKFQTKPLRLRTALCLRGRAPASALRIQLILVGSSNVKISKKWILHLRIDAVNTFRCLMKGRYRIESSVGPSNPALRKGKEIRRIQISLNMMKCPNSLFTRSLLRELVLIWETCASTRDRSIPTGVIIIASQRL